MSEKPLIEPKPALSLLRDCTDILDRHDIPFPEKEAELMVVSGAGLDKVTIYRDDPLIGEAEIRKIESMLRRRIKREPLAYILGYADFHSVRIKVGPGLLVPRPETELLVEEVLKRVPDSTGTRILDLCTGSGCLAIAIARNLPNSEVLATDISANAVEMARDSAVENGTHNVTFRQGELFGPAKNMRFDCIVSNPPYVKSGDVNSLQLEISKWEPRKALDGGIDGLDFFRRILEEASSYLKPDGLLMLELGMDQASEVAEIAGRKGLKTLSVIRDYRGIIRIIVLMND